MALKIHSQTPVSDVKHFVIQGVWAIVPVANVVDRKAECGNEP
jgi:hypothetical protein